MLKESKIFFVDGMGVYRRPQGERVATTWTNSRSQAVQLQTFSDVSEVLWFYRDRIYEQTMPGELSPDDVVGFLRDEELVGVAEWPAADPS